MNDLLAESQQLRKNVELTLSAQQQDESKPIVAVWGLMNAGKSSLLNMLTEHVENEYFKTNDFRETTEVQVFETEHCIFVDTPGLDANSQDNAEALKGVQQANIVLFVHQLQGELEKVEIDFLKNVRDSFGEFANQNIVMILAKVDKESPEKVNTIQDKILEQCQEMLGFKPQCFQISNTRYQKGVCEKKDGLIKHSHMNELKDYIASILSDSHLVTLTRQKYKRDEIKSQLRQQLELIHSVRTQKVNELLQPLEQMNELIEDLAKIVETKRQQYLKI